LAEDIAAALDDEPEARRTFDSLATFYRKGWLR
jgi:bacteriocin resistance YdeI/OmpD-like protein